MKIFKGKIVGFKGSRDSGIGYLSIKCSRTCLVFNVPCQSDCIAKDLDRHFGDVISGYMYQEVYTRYNEEGTIITGITPVNENIKGKNREAKNMTTTTNKDKGGKTPSAPDKRVAPNTLSQKELRRRRDAMLAMGKRLGFKEKPLDGAIIWFQEGTLFYS